MHELCHNLGLCHGGDDNLMYMPYYLSVMNYYFQTDGLIKDGEDGYINYSNFGNNIIPPLVETSLNESIGLNGGAAIDNYGTRWYCRYLGQWWDRRDPNANSALDWNCNLVPIGVVEANINDGQWDEEDPTLSTLFAHNDWDNLVFDGGLVGLPIPSLNVLSPFKVEQQGGAMEELSFDIAQTFYRPYAIVLSSNGFDVVSPGLSTNIPITLTNIGALTTTVSFNNTTSTWFDLSSIPVSVTLAPSAILTYEISLNVPGSAATGSTQEITIEATSQESLRMRDTMTLHARVGPMAWFEAEPVTGNTPHLISFADLSIGEVNSWLWTFGDGFTSNQQNPSHVYTTPGIYTVSLTVTGPDGVDTYTRTDLVRVQPHQAYLPIIQR
jgi:hypothetical protein